MMSVKTVKIGALYLYNRILVYRLSLLLILCVVLGGTAQDVQSYKIILYLVSLLFIGHSLSSSNKPFSSLLRPPVIFGCVLIGLYLLYIIPLPPSIWTELSGREVIIRGYNLVGMDLPWLPISLTPEKTLFSLFNFIPAISIILVMKLSASQREINKSIFSIIVIALISSLLGLFQILDNSQSMILYEIFNEGSPIGVFSNVNHQASLITLSIPLAMYMAFGRAYRSPVNPTKAFAIAAIFIFCITTILTRSSAGYLFLIFTLIASIYLLSRGSSYNKVVSVFGLLIITMLLGDSLLYGGQLQDILTKFSVESQTSRSVIYKTSLLAQKDLGLLGGGPGSFSDIYRMYENRSQLSNVFINEAHNDYLQIWIELGVLGIITVISGLIWFISIVIKALFSSNNSNYKLLSFCISAIVLIFHSIVDYPLRTISLLVVFTFLLLLIDQEWRNTISLD